MSHYTHSSMSPYTKHSTENEVKKKKNEMGFIKIESVKIESEWVSEWITCIAMTSGSKVVTKLVNSGQLFLTRRRKLLAFQVMNLDGSPFSSTFSACERQGFFEDPSFATGLKKRFIAQSQCLSLSLSLLLSQLTVVTFSHTNKISQVFTSLLCNVAAAFFFFFLMTNVIPIMPFLL